MQPDKSGKNKRKQLAKM